MAHVALRARLSSTSFPSPNAVAELNAKVEERIKKECPGVRWIANYAVLGPYDYLDLFEAPDNEAATKVALIVRSFGPPKPTSGWRRPGSASPRWPVP